MKQFSYSNAPALPFFVVIVLIDVQVLCTRNRLMWQKEIKMRAQQNILFFPVSQLSQLEELRSYGK